MKYLMAMILVFGVAHAVIFDENQNDNELLEPFLFENREETASKNALGISGDIRITGRVERIKDGREIPLSKRAVGDIVVKPLNDRIYTYKVEANIYLDKTCGPLWTAMKLTAVNNLSVAKGTYDQLKLKRALIGYKPYKCGKTELYGELGRQMLSDKFDSELMFGSPLDGGFFHATTSPRGMGKFFVQGAFLVVNAEKGQYGWVGALGWEDIYCTGFFVKYALIDWGRDRPYRLGVDRVIEKTVKDDKGNDKQVKATERLETRFRPSYLTSQILVGYDFCLCGKDSKIFAAFLYNHDARKFKDPGFRSAGLSHEPYGFYAGVEFGKVKKCGDWAVKAEVDYAQAFCFPEFDNNGIGNNIGSDNGLFSLASLGSKEAFVISDTRSRLNYVGPKVELAYAFTDDLSGRLQYMTSWAIKRFFGTRRRYERFEAKLIYSF